MHSSASPNLMPQFILKHLRFFTSLYCLYFCIDTLFSLHKWRPLVLFFSFCLVLFPRVSSKLQEPSWFHHFLWPPVLRTLLPLFCFSPGCFLHLIADILSSTYSLPCLIHIFILPWAHWSLTSCLENGYGIPDSPFEWNWINDFVGA